jgi:hypothetical protein
MDFYILCLPITIVWSLQMTLRRKITILSVLAFGLVSVSVAIVRLPVLFSVTSMQTDVSVDVGKMIVVASFEVQCAIVAVNLPSLSSLWTKLGIKEDFVYEHISQGGPQDPAQEKQGSQARSKKNSILSFTSRLQRGLEENDLDESFEQKQVQKRVKMRRRTGKHVADKDRPKDAETEKLQTVDASTRPPAKDGSGFLDSRRERSRGRDHANSSEPES